MARLLPIKSWGVRGCLQFMCLGVVLALLNACSAREIRKPPDESQPYFIHTVSHEGETLAGIAEWYTGAAQNWKIILTHNPDLDVERLQMGAVVRIPNRLVLTEEPWQPQAVVTGQFGGSKKPRVYNPIGAQIGAVPGAEQAEQEWSNEPLSESGTPAGSEPLEFEGGTQLQQQQQDQQTQAADEVPEEPEPVDSISVEEPFSPARKKRMDALLDEIMNE